MGCRCCGHRFEVGAPQVFEVRFGSFVRCSITVGSVAASLCSAGPLKNLDSPEPVHDGVRSRESWGRHTHVPHCVTAFRKAHRSGKLRWEQKSSFLTDYSRFNSFVSKLYQLKWYVNIAPP